MKTGDIIIISDEQTLIGMLEDGKNPALADVIRMVHPEFQTIITDIVKINVPEIGTWTICSLKDSGLRYVYKDINGTDREHYIYYQPNEVNFAERSVFKKYYEWLFDDDGDFIKEINFTNNDGNEFIYEMAFPTLYGTCYEIASGPLLTSITEWVSTTQCDNPQILCIEIGDGIFEGEDIEDRSNEIENDDPYVMFFMGAQILENDIEIFEQ